MESQISDLRVSDVEADIIADLQERGFGQLKKFFIFSPDTLQHRVAQLNAVTVAVERGLQVGSKRPDDFFLVAIANAGDFFETLDQHGGNFLRFFITLFHQDRLCLCSGAEQMESGVYFLHLAQPVKLLTDQHIFPRLHDLPHIDIRKTDLVLTAGTAHPD